jgi:hypothetical protein
MFWTVQRDSDSGLVTPVSLVFPADRSVAVSRRGDDADGPGERMASNTAATRITATPPITSQERRVRTISEGTNWIYSEVPSATLPQAFRLRLPP